MILNMVCVDEQTHVVDFGIEMDSPDDGPPRVTMAAPEGKFFAQVIEPFARLDVPATTLPLLIDGAVQWVETAHINEQRARKVTDMSQSCADAILAGFVSLALGAAYTYPAKPNDQLNLIGSVAASFYPNVGADWLTPFWCADGAGVWAFRAHTAAQIQQVGVDGKNAILNCMTINERLAAQIMAAGADQLAAIAWPA